jgi:hypothetical protein
VLGGRSTSIRSAPQGVIFAMRGCVQMTTDLSWSRYEMERMNLSPVDTPGRSHVSGDQADMARASAVAHPTH